MSPVSSSNSVNPSFPRRGLALLVRLRRFVVLAVSVGASVWLWNWLSVDETGAPITQQSGEPSMEIENLKSLLVRSHGQPLWQLSAQRVVVATDGSSTTATGIGKGIYFRNGQPFLKLAAPLVRLSSSTNDLQASGGVTASGPNDFSFRTSRALWRSQKKIVDCPTPVVAQLKGLQFQTPRLSYDWDKGLLKCPQPVEVVGRGVVLRGQRLEATLKTRQIKLLGGAELIFDPTVAKVDLPR